MNKAYKEAGQNAYFGNGFEAGVRFVLERVKKYSTPDALERSEQFSIPHEFTQRDNYSGQCSICGKGILLH